MDVKKERPVIIIGKTRLICQDQKELDNFIGQDWVKDIDFSLEQEMLSDMEYSQLENIL